MTDNQGKEMPLSEIIIQKIKRVSQISSVGTMNMVLTISATDLREILFAHSIDQLTSLRVENERLREERGRHWLTPCECTVDERTGETWCCNVCGKPTPTIKKLITCQHDWDEGFNNVSKCKKCGKYSA